ncbi:MAG TPA: hypothetical protein VIM61_09280 [Chthoniobacterales bacterium]
MENIIKLTEQLAAAETAKEKLQQELAILSREVTARLNNLEEL